MLTVVTLQTKNRPRTQSSDVIRPAFTGTDGALTCRGAAVSVVTRPRYPTDRQQYPTG